MNAKTTTKSDNALLQKVEEAIFVGMEYLVSHTLKSSWTTEGYGWQELLPESDWAGLYASCQGLILLSKVGFFDGKKEEIIRNIFYNHICPIFENETTEARKIMDQRRAWTTTTRLAIFIEAYNAIERPIDKSELFEKVLRQVLSCDNNKSIWYFSISYNINDNYHDNDYFVLATSGVIHSLIVSNELSKERKNHALCFFSKKATRYLSKIEQKKETSDSYDKLIVCLWSLSNLLRYDDSLYTDKQFLNTIYHCIAQHTETWNYKRLPNQFYVKDCGAHDYYSCNLTLLFIYTMINLLELKVISSLQLRTNITPMIEKISCEILDNKLFRKADFRFWEHYWAILALINFKKAAFNYPEICEGGYMHIYPKHFRDFSFPIKDNLIVVLMPFTPRWSRAVYKVFESSGKDKGFEVWRSDNNIKDDQIMQTIWEQINCSRMVIADCTGRNPNVFYEIGIAHTIGKPVFLCAQNRKDFPFDISAIRSYDYGTLPEDLDELGEKIKKFIDNL